MAWLLDPAEARVVDILEGARGSTAALGSPERQAHIPAGRLRRSAGNASLRAEGYPLERFDKAYHLAWTESDNADGPQNSYDPTLLETHTLVVEIGHVYAADAAARSAFVDAAAGTTESGAASVATPTKVAQSLAGRVRRALETTGLFSDAATDPRLVMCERIAPTTIDDLGGGRLVSSTRYRVVIERLAASAYDP